MTSLSPEASPSKCYYREGDLDSLTAQERMALFKLFIDPEDRTNRPNPD